MAQNPPQFSERFLQFTELTLDTKPPTDSAYKQYHLRVDVNSQQENACIRDIIPKRTSDSDGEERQSSSKKSGWARGITGNVIVGLNPQAAFTSTAMNTNEETVGSERRHFISRITEHHSKGNVEWGISIEDVNLRKGGIDLKKWGINTGNDVLPTACFEFLGDSDIPAPPPKCMDIVITSYWSMVLPGGPEGTWIHKLLHFIKSRSTGNAQTTSFSNLFQIVALTADLSDLQEKSRYHYIANLKVRPQAGACDPLAHNVVVKRKAAVDVTPVVVDGMYI